MIIRHCTILSLLKRISLQIHLKKLPGRGLSLKNTKQFWSSTLENVLSGEKNGNSVSASPEWTHPCRIAIDSTSKFHVEKSSKLRRFWKASPRGNYDIDSTWKFQPAFDFQNRRNIDDFSTWTFDFVSTLNGRNFCTCCCHFIIF